MAWGIIFGKEKNGGGFWPFWVEKRVISDLKHLPTLDAILIYIQRKQNEKINMKFN